MHSLAHGHLSYLALSSLLYSGHHLVRRDHTPITGLAALWHHCLQLPEHLGEGAVPVLTRQGLADELHTARTGQERLTKLISNP